MTEITLKAAIYTIKYVHVNYVRLQRISAVAGLIYIAGRIVYALGYYTGGMF